MKNLSVTLLISAVAAEGEKFTETSAFLGIIIAVAVVACIAITCIGTTMSNKAWLEEQRKKYEGLSKIADTPKGKIEYR